jgi:hypothetical protein
LISHFSNFQEARSFFRAKNMEYGVKILEKSAKYKYAPLHLLEFGLSSCS